MGVIMEVVTMTVFAWTGRERSSKKNRQQAQV